ncbi:FG-GAP repeat domain-containing protein [Streptomyces omiyaensis]|uniref:FG-GAP repeat domain-containing protein n=1 Tax=Streptomyces omiyaensis TaxID=68247 RepID=UPI0036F9E2C8
MSVARIRRARLAASVATVLAASLGAGVLTVPAAVAAPGPSAAAPAAAEGGVARMEPHTTPLAAGAGGFFSTFTYNSDRLFWTSYATGRTSALAYGSAAGGDLYSAGRVITDMSTGAAFTLPEGAYPIGGAGGYVFGTDKDETKLTMYTAEGGREVTGLPAGARDLTVRPGSPKEAVLGYWGADNKDHNALLDLASGRITETFETPGQRAYRDMPDSPTPVTVDDERITWPSWNSTAKTMTAVVHDRATGEERRIELGRTGFVRSIGNWLVHHGTDPLTGKSTLVATSLTGGAATAFPLLDRVDATAVPDGTGALLVGGGRLGVGQGAYRITLGADGRPTTAVMGVYAPAELAEMSPAVVPTGTVDLDKTPSPTVKFLLNHLDGKVTFTLRHTRTGKTYGWTQSGFDVYDDWWKDFSGGFPYTGSGNHSGFWSGTLDARNADGSAARTQAYNGAYTWEMTAASLKGVGPDLKKSGSFAVTRAPRPHDFDDNGSPDLLARDASGVLWADSSFARSSATTVPETRIGGGWQIYDRIEATGNIAGSTHADIVARDKAGVLWLYQGNGTGGFTGRVQVGGGWQAYDQISGGSDYTGDGRPDVLATDRTGALYLYRSTGSATKPFETRKKIGTGWLGYGRLVGAGNLAGAAAGDLLARDKDGVLWMYLGKGDGTFTGRTRIGAGFGRYSELVGAGDFDGDRKNDLLAVDPATRTTYVFKGTGQRYTPLDLTREATSFFKGAARDLHG